MLEVTKPSGEAEIQPVLSSSKVHILLITYCKVPKLKVKDSAVLSVAPGTVSSMVVSDWSHRPTLSQCGRGPQENMSNRGQGPLGASWRLPANRGHGVEILSDAPYAVLPL